MKLSSKYVLVLFGYLIAVAVIKSLTGWSPSTLGSLAAFMSLSALHIIMAIEQLGDKQCEQPESAEDEGTGQ